VVNQVAVTVTAVAAALGSLLYLGHKLNQLIGVIKVLTDLPAKHDELVAVTATNSAAIVDLSDQIRHLTAIVTNYGEP